MPSEVLTPARWLIQKIILPNAHPTLKRKLDALSQDDGWAVARFLGATIYAMAGRGIYPNELWTGDRDVSDGVGNH